MLPLGRPSLAGDGVENPGPEFTFSSYVSRQL